MIGSISRLARRDPWALLVLFGALWVCASACSSTEKPWSTSTNQPDPYRQLTPDQIGELRAAIVQLEAGELMPARSALASLKSRAPRDVVAAIWHQEARLAWVTRRAELMLDVTEATHSPREALRDSYRAEAEEAPSPLAYFLAARLEEDELAAQLLLKKAIELDPRMSWAHYALAHVAARAGDWGSARTELERTFELQPDHLPALRLYGWLQAGAGDTESAIAALESWLKRSSEDLLATTAVREELRLDLALAYSAAGDQEKALETLSELSPGWVSEVRRLAALAVMEEGRGDLDKSRRAVASARNADPDSLLPAVQEALLLEIWLGDPEAARQAWERVLDLASRSNELAAGLQRFRAEVHLQRLDRQLASRP